MHVLFDMIVGKGTLLGTFPSYHIIPFYFMFLAHCGKTQAHQILWIWVLRLFIGQLQYES